MNKSKVDWIAIIVFAVIAIVLGSLWAAHARDSGMLKDPQTAGIAASIAQPSVLIAALLTMATLSRGSFRKIGWRLGPGRAYLVVFGVVVLIIALFSAAAFASGFLHSAGPRTPKSGQIFIALPILLIMSCLFSFTEEFGWRGFMLPKLLPLGIRPALLISGMIWFLWEAPLVYFGLLDSTMIQVNLPLTLACHFIQTCCVAIAFGYLRVRFNSVFLPTFAHGMLNAMGGLSFMLLVETNPIWGDFGGPIGSVFLLILAAIIWRELGRGLISRTSPAPASSLGGEERNQRAKD